MKIMTQKKMTHDEAWLAFRRGNLKKLDFIPDIVKMHSNFDNQIRNSCCSKKRAITQNFYKKLGNRLSATE